MLTIDSQMIDGNLAIDAQRQYGNHADYLDVNAVIQHGRIAVDGYEKPAGLQCYIPLFSNISPVWGELALDAGSHVRGSVAKRTNPVTGLIETLGNNLPRFELHDNLLALLDEPDIKNHCEDSEAFRAAISGWLNQNCTVTDNAADAPDGNTTADKIVEAVDVGQVHDIQDNFLVGDFTDDVSVTCSAYVKKAERGWVKLSLRNKANAWVGAYFDLTNGVIGVEGVDSYAITPAADGFYRCSITHDIANGVTNPTFNIAVASADNTDTYNGDGASGIYVWGAQVEEFPVLTTYIATSGATATRATESGYPLWTLPLGLFDAEGTCSVWARFGYPYDAMPAGTSSGVLSTSSATESFAYNRRAGGGEGRPVVSNDGTLQAYSLAVAWTADTWYKLVVKWSASAGKMRVGYDSGAGIVWGTEVAFDGSYTLGANLRAAFGLYGPIWLHKLMLFDRVPTTLELNSYGSP